MTNNTKKPPEQTDIEKHAYRLYEERGRKEGHHEEDWHAAVRALSDDADEDADADAGREIPAGTATATPRVDQKSEGKQGDGRQSDGKQKQQPRA